MLNPYKNIVKFCDWNYIMFSFLFVICFHSYMSISACSLSCTVHPLLRYIFHSWFIWIQFETCSLLEFRLVWVSSGLYITFRTFNWVTNVVGWGQWKLIHVWLTLNIKWFFFFLSLAYLITSATLLLNINIFCKAVCAFDLTCNCVTSNLQLICVMLITHSPLKTYLNSSNSNMGIVH